MGGDSIVMTRVGIPPRIKSWVDPKYIKHVICEGARFHVLRWVDTWEGAFKVCSNPDCIMNKEYNERVLHTVGTAVN